MPEQRRPNRRQAIALVGVVGLLVACVALVAGGPAEAPRGAAATATSETRDLRVTDTDRGTVARADTTTVLYDGTGGRVEGGPAGADVSAQSAGSVTVASLTEEEPCPPATSPSSTTAPATSSTSIAPCGSTTSTALPPSSTTTAAPSTTTTAAPTTTTTEAPPAVGEDPVGPGAAPASPVDPGPGSPIGGGEADEGGAAAAPDAANPGSSTATLTELLPVGQTATRGSVLYRADDEPIVALLSTVPLFRDLRTGVEDGADVRAVESELQALGYSGFTVDEHFDAATANAVRAWERDLGRAAPDGIVTVGEVRLLDEPTTVLEHPAVVGDLLRPDDAVLVLGADSRVVEADVEVSAAAEWAVGTALVLGWADGSTSTGSVVEVGRDVLDGQVPIVVALAPGTGGQAPVGSRVDLVRTVVEHADVVAVPVSAVVQGEDGPAVRVVLDGDDDLVAVELGIVEDGWVEVTRGLAAGTEVRLPA